jgi:hypothetical protein
VHALAVPVLVKKMFRVSDLATELVVSVMWRLGPAPHFGEEDEAVVQCPASGSCSCSCRLAAGTRPRKKATELLNKYKGVGGMGRCCGSQRAQQAVFLDQRETM